MPQKSRARRASMPSRCIRRAPKSPASARSSSNRASTRCCSPIFRPMPSPPRSASRARPRASWRSARSIPAACQVPRADDAVAATERRRVEDAIEKLKDDKATLQAIHQAAETQKRLIDNLTQLPTQACARATAVACTAARLGPAFRPDRRARRRGAEDHPRHADQDARRRPADQGSGRQARLAGADAAGAHRGQGVRECRAARWRPISSSATR